MTEQDLNINVVAKPDDKLVSEISELAIIKSGWGVFENQGGLSRMPRSLLRSVWEKEVQAKTEAKSLNESEGRLDFETPDDQESPIYDQVRFDTGRVALTGIKPEVVLQATYERVSE